MRIAIIGTGYVGLVAGACFADSGNHVYCVDNDEDKIRTLKSGVIPIYEPGLETIVQRGFSQGRLVFTTSTEEAVRSSDVIFMAVGTPPRSDGQPDLSYLKQAAESVAKSMTGYRLIVNKSTVPIGSYQVVRDWMKPHTSHSFDVISNPEFLKEGTAVHDFLRPERIVIGTEKREVFKKMEDLYAPFIRQGNPILWMDPVSAEITKYACNSYLASRISFMNEMAGLCEKVGGDIEQVRRGMMTDTRIGPYFLYAGAGYGGSCFPKDVQALLVTAENKGVKLGIVASAEEANARQKRKVAEKILRHFGGKITGLTFALWGLSFKPNTDDMREAPSIVIIEELLKAGARIQAFDPVAHETAARVFGNRILFMKNAYEALNGADALVVVTEWNEFRNPDFDLIKKTLKKPVIFDGRNLYQPETMKNQGFTYFGIGRGLECSP
jgi:UDPglucose 6-dehydrogenase